jgi:hypothetical protein
VIAALASLLLAAGQPQPHGADCTMANAVPADAQRMAREPARWLGRCVRIEGYVSYNHFYSDVAGFYRYFASDYRDHRNDGWLGLYPRDRYGFRGPMRRGAVAGVVHDCETDRDRAEAERPDSIVMMTGFCHYRYGLVLNPASFRAAEAVEFERQIGEVARSSFGDLLSGSEAGEVPPEVAALVERFAAAILARDEERLSALVEFVDRDDQAHEEGAWRRSFFLGEANSPLGDVRASSQRIMFRERRSARSEDPFGGWHVCFCRTPDCTGIWPISTVDATASPEHPYWCASMYNRDYRLPPVTIGISTRPAYPLEPARTAFRRLSESSRR